MTRVKSRKPEWPAAAVEQWPIGKVSPYAHNARKHPESQVDQLVDLIRQFGWTTAVLVDEAGEIIAGHGRVLAAEKMGLKTVPVMVARGWTDAQKRAYRLADNAVSARSEWLPDLVRSELAELESMDFDTSQFGLDAIELPPLEEITASAPRAPRSKTTIFVSVGNLDAEKARRAIVAALDKQKIAHNL